MPPVRVTIVWRDAEISTGWTALADAVTHRAPAVHTTGYMIADDETQVTVALCWSEDRDETQVNGSIVIPKAWIDTTTVLGGSP